MGVLEAGGEFRHLLGFCLETEMHNEQSARGCSQPCYPSSVTACQARTQLQGGAQQELWYLGTHEQRSFSQGSTEGCITSRKAWMAKAVSQSWDPFVP